MLYTPYYSKKKLLTIMEPEASITSTTAMPREPSMDKQLNTAFFVTTVIAINQSPMTCLLCCRFYSRDPLRETPYRVHNKHPSSRLCSKKKNLNIFDTSRIIKKSETRRIIFSSQILTFFSHLLYYCMELLYMETAEKRAPFLDTYFPHVKFLYYCT